MVDLHGGTRLPETAGTIGDARGEAAGTEESGDVAEALTFEAAVRRLESLVASLERGELGLEASIEAYEEGLKLARSCMERLDRAELRIQQLAELTGDADVDAP